METQIEIRHASALDINALAAVDAECFPAAEAATRMQLEERVNTYGEHFWLLFCGGELAAFVDGMVTNEPELRDEMYENARLHDEGGAWQMIFGVNTRPKYRRRGFAGMLIKQAIADAKAQGRLGMVLTCKDELVHYYAAFGFENEGVSDSIHGNVRWNKMRLIF